MASDNDRTVLFESIRQAEGLFREFPDSILISKLGGEKKSEELALEFMLYVQHDKKRQRNEALVEGARLMKLLLKRMQEKHIPIHLKTIPDCLHMIAAILMDERIPVATKKSVDEMNAEEIEVAFPGYAAAGWDMRKMTREQIFKKSN